MRKMNIARRRGTTIAAAALSMALVAPIIQPVANPAGVPMAFASTPDQKAETNPHGTGNMYPGVNADGVYQTSVNEERYTFADQPIKTEKAIESGAKRGTKNAIEGYVINQRNGDLSVHPRTGGSYRPIPMEGVRVYAQWVERDGSVSPVYTTTTGADGRYTIAMKSYTDSLGKVRKFDADPNFPENEKIRVWVDNPDPEAFTQLYGYNSGSLGPYGNTYDTPGGMKWLIGSDRVTNVRFTFGEKPQNEIMHNLEKSAENVARGSGLTGYGQVQGKVFWNLWSSQGAFVQNLMYAYDKADVPATGLKVYGSYLSDYAVQTIESEAPKDLGFDKIRGAGWTRDQEAALQNWIKRKMAEEGKDKWVAETAEAIVGQNGDYTLQFKGTFGTKRFGRGTGGSQGNPLTRNDGTEVIFPDGSKHVAWDLLGTVAPSPDYGTFQQGRLGNKAERMPKHVNWDWLFVSTEDVDGVGITTPFHTNGYLPRTRYNTDNGWSAQMNMAEAGLARTNYITLYSDYTVFDVENYDTQENFAKPGDVAPTKTSGLPTKFVDGLKYQIEWTDTNTGEVVHTCDVVAADANTSIPSCDLDTGDKELFPNGITETTTFAATLYPINEENGERGRAIATDAFTVLVGWAAKYEDKVGQPGVEMKSGLPTFDNVETDEVETEAGDSDNLPSKVKSYEIPRSFTRSLDKDYKVNVDKNTGEVTVTFPEDAEPGDTIDVPVNVTFENGTKTTGTARFMVEQSDEQEPPVWEDATTTPGEPVVVEKDPSTGDVPEDATVETQGPGTATIDPETGDITVTPTDEAKPGDEVIVTVKDKDGNEIGTAKVTIEASQKNPNWDEQVETTPGTPVEIEKTKDSGDVEPGTKVEVLEDGPGTATIDEETGTITVTPSDEAKPGDTILVEVKDKDDQSIDIIQVDVVEPEKKPDWDDASTTPGESVTVEKDPESGDVPEGATTEVKGPGEAEIDEDGNIVVTPNEDAKPGDEIVVTVKDKDGNELDTVTVTIDEPEAPVVDTNTTVEPEYPDTLVDPNKGGGVKVKPEFKDKDGKTTKAPEDSEFSIDKDFKAPEGYTVDIDENTGEITVNVDKSKLNGDTAEEFEVPVTVTYPDGSKDNAKAKFELDTDGDGNPDSKDTDDDGDGVSDEDEKNAGTNPKDASDKPAPAWGDGETTPGGTVTLPKENDVKVPDTAKVVVEDKDGNVVGEGKINEDGSVEVTIPEDAAPGDYTVVITDGDKELDRSKITVNESKKTSSEKAEELSSRKGCTESLIGFGLPLLALIPLGIASQTAIPGLQNIQAQVGRQIQDANTALQNQLGIMDPRLAKASADFQAQLKGAGANLSQVLGGIAVLAYGIAAITTIATKCGPGNTEIRDTNVDINSIFGGSSTRGEKEGDNASSLDKQESSSSSSKRQENEDAPANPEAEVEANDAEAPAAEENTEE